MNYELHVVKGRSATTALKLIEGETTVGRHNSCAIRIKSSQVSRRHCEISQKNGKLVVRDLNSSNGTMVNGKRIKDISILQDGDELTIGGVVLRIVRIAEGAAESAAPVKGSIKPSDTAELNAIPAEDDEFEISLELDQDDLGFNDTVPLDDESDAPSVAPGKATGRAGAAPGNAAPPKPKAEAKPAPKAAAPAKRTPEDDAIDEFLLDLKLDDE